MINQLRAEFLKLRSTRTALGLVLGMTALVVLVSLLSVLLSPKGQLVGVENQRMLLGIGSLSATFAGLFGVLLVTSEYRHGTIRPTLLFVPRRTRIVVAKLGASVFAGVLLGVIGEGAGFGLGSFGLAVRHVPLALSATQATQLTLGTLIGAACWAGIGVGVGFIIRAQVGAVIVLLAWAYVVENLLFALAPSVGRYTPYQAQSALVGLTTKHLVPAATGAVLLVAWVVVLALIGEMLTLRRDVS
jgi:ABC-type transport system involved in multi-copper enzyme maturation permease subunit